MNPHYDIPNLKLTDEYLADPILLALAWKRAHGYVRSLNWYADNFELDASSLFLQENCDAWANELSSKKIKLKPLELVPAPKTNRWEFVEPNSSEDTEGEEAKGKQCLNWQPITGEQLSLRPLAHIGIKEQVFFTHLMSCLANTVETEQGNPETPLDEVHTKNVVNYGNRLYCYYDNEGNAQHNYGATSIYSKYFVDYRNFLKRPYHFAQQQSTEKLPSEEVYIVELDLKQFFDRVRRATLVEKIKKLIKKQVPEFENKKFEETSVAKLLHEFDSWQWSTEAEKSYKICPKNEDGNDKKGKAPKGIPQGLVAGGFLANIYLLKVDKTVASFVQYHLLDNTNKKEKLTTEIDLIQQYFKKKQLNFKVIDYCRYVDDIRLVITAPKLTKEFTLKTLTEQVAKAANVFIRSKKLNLRINTAKTKVIPYRGKPKGISSQVNEQQSSLSGPLGPEQLDNLISELETLLVLSTAESTDQDTCEHNHIHKRNKLADIERSTFDIREDTLRRFAANKLASALKLKRHFTSREVNEQGNPIAGEWDYLQERVARRLIAVWSKDPSLVLLLKKGLELFPSPRVLEPILEQFEVVLKRKDAQQIAIMNYCLAEIFRHSATVIHKKDPQAIPAQADVNSYFEVLQNKAASLLPTLKPNSMKWDFLAEQARFLLLVRMDTTLERPVGDIKQDLIFKLAKGFRNITLPKKLERNDISLCVLLANQLLENNQPLLRAALELIAKQDTGSNAHSEKLKLLTQIATQNPELAGQLIQQARLLKAEYSWVFTDEIEGLADKIYLDIAPSRKPLEKITTKQSLVQLFIRPDNPFANEIMAIKLMQALIEKANADPARLVGQQINLAATQVEFDTGYSEIPKYQHFDTPLKITEFKTQPPLSQDFLDTESVLSTEQLALRKVAFVVRAALASSKDTTGFGVSISPKAGYRGLKSTRSKRQIGHYTTPESLAGEGAQTSGWLTTLLTKLLRWPGIRANEQGYRWPETLGVSDVQKLLKERLELLKTNYCQLSQMPTLPELVSPHWEESKTDLNVVMVQSKLPKQADFRGDLYLNDPQYRSQHRQHIASVAQLTVQHIKAEDLQTDLIVWPELAVHQDDIDVLKQLAQKTHAIIFAGLSFIPDANGRPINTAIWLVPPKHNGNSSNLIMRFQGKQHMTAGEEKLNIFPWRPYQLMLELSHPQYPQKEGFKLTGAICYDATDIKLSADLADKSNAFIISALNKDVNTFDSMVEALHYHMYQPIVLVNTGEFGGSYAMAPYKEHHDKLIAHNTGKNQIAISSFKLNMFDFRRDEVGNSAKSGLKIKAKPAGVSFKSSG